MYIAQQASDLYFSGREFRFQASKRMNADLNDLFEKCHVYVSNLNAHDSTPLEYS